LIYKIRIPTSGNLNVLLPDPIKLKSKSPSRIKSSLTLITGEASLQNKKLKIQEEGKSKRLKRLL